MIKYAKITDEQTGLCSVGMGTNIEFYKSIGMSELDVEQSDIDDKWYLAELCPKKSEEEKLQEAKKAKYDEANIGAKKYLESGNALYELEEGKHIEAFDGNMSKMTGYLLAFEAGIYKPDDTVIWVTKEDETLHLTKEQIAQILQGIGEVQAYVWSVQFIAYIQAIEKASTVEEVEMIKIDYQKTE